MQKRMYKVLTPIQKHDGGSWMMRIGKGYDNKDSSINVYLDAIPVGTVPGRGLQLTIMQLDDRDLRQIEEARANAARRGEGGASKPRTSMRVPGPGDLA